MSDTTPKAPAQTPPSNRIRYALIGCGAEGNVLLDQSMQIPRHYGSMGLPITLFLRADGTLASMHMGEISREALNAASDRLGGST